MSQIKSTVKVIAEPEQEPVTLAEARDWCRIDDTNSDWVLLLLIRAMREHAENLTGRAFCSRTLRLYLSGWPLDCNLGARIELPHPPLRMVGSPSVAVESFNYIDTDGVLQTLAPSDYVVHDEYEPGFIVPAWDVYWPTIRSVPDALQITYYVGYASTSAIPRSVRLWMAARIATLFETREQLVVGGNVQPLPRSFEDGLLDSLVLGSRLF